MEDGLEKHKQAPNLQFSEAQQEGNRQYIDRFIKPFKTSKFRKFIFPILSVFLLVVGITAGTILVQSSQDIREKAFEDLVAERYDYDVVVVGASSGGVSAAIQAARGGSKVALLEKTDWIGGQMTAAAVSTMDGNYDFPSGIYSEFIERVRNYYQEKGKSVGTCYWTLDSICFEPSVGQKVLYDIIEDTRSRILPNGQVPKLDLYLRTEVKEVSNSTDKIAGLVTEDGRVFMFSVLVEATEYGDILALSSAKYRAGNTTSTNLDKNACVQDITYTAVIKRYENLPSQLRLNTPPPGYNKEVEDEFARIVNRNGASFWNDNYPVNWDVHNAYRGLPDSSNPDNYDAGSPSNYSSITKTVVNWANDYPYKVSSLDKAEREKINCEAKLKTLQFIYYAQNVLGEGNWSIANDEGFDTAYNKEENLCDNIPAEFKEIEKHFPVQPYIREARRGVGIYTLTAKDIYREGVFPRAKKFFSSSVAVGDYPIDLHACKEQEDLEETLESVSDMPPGFVGGPFQIPFEAFIPEQINGLVLAEKNLSMTRLANGALRLQPITMLAGQAAGLISALSIERGVQPRDLSVGDVQNRLLKEGSMLYGFSDVKQDNPYFEEIQKIALAGYMSGYGGSWKFGPDDLLSRAEISVVLSRLNSLPIQIPETPTFEDVEIDKWYYKWVETLYKSGLTAGCSETPKLFCPNNNVTREELAVFVVKSVGEQPYNGDTVSFSDVPKSTWSHKWVEKVAELGLMKPLEDSLFGPYESVKRGEIAKTLYDILVYLGKI